MENRNAYEDKMEVPIPMLHRFTTVRSETPEEITVCNNAEPSTPQRMYIWTQLLAACAVSMGLLLDGFAVGCIFYTINSVLQSIIHENYFEKVLLISRYIPLVSILGNLLAAPLVAYVGRKYTIMGTGVPLFIAWILFASAPNLHWYFAGQVLFHLCTGVLVATFSIYMSEISQPEIRGAMGLLPVAFKNVGISLGYFLSAYLVWTKMIYIAIGILILFLLLMFFIPESPRWYVARGRNSNAREAIQWLRGEYSNIEDEIQDVTRSQLEADETKGNAFLHLFFMENISAVYTALALMIFQSFSGRYVLLLCAQSMSPSYDTDYTAQHQKFRNITYATDFVGAFIAIFLVDRIGRKALLYISYAFIILSFITLGLCNYFEELDVEHHIQWTLILCVVLHALGISMGYGSISWLILGEILPLKSRSIAASLITGISYACNYYMQIQLFHVIKTTSIYVFIFICVLIHIVEIVFVIFCVPETRGVRLEQIEFNLTYRVKTISNTTPSAL